MVLCRYAAGPVLGLLAVLLGLGLSVPGSGLFAPLLGLLLGRGRSYQDEPQTAENRPNLQRAGVMYASGLVWKIGPIWGRF